MRISLGRVERAVSFIEAELNNPFTLEDVATHAGISRFSLHRLFQASVGESLKSYIRKRRLTEAAERLKGSQERILELALGAGFHSQEAFTRAFRSFFGVTPGRYRRDCTARRQPGLFKVSPLLLAHRYEGVTHEPRIEMREEPLVIRGHGIGADFEDDTPISVLWERVIELVHTPDSTDDLIGVTTSSHPAIPLTEEQAFVYIAGVAADEWPTTERYSLELEVPSGLYAVFTHRGPLEHIIDTVNYAWASWLPGCGYLKSDRPDLELVSYRRMISATPWMELWVSIERDD